MEDSRPGGAFQTGLPNGMTRPLRKLAPGAEGWGRRPEQAPASGTDQSLGFLGWNPFSTGEAAPGQEEIEEILGQRLGLHRS